MGVSRVVLAGKSTLTDSLVAAAGIIAMDQVRPCLQSCVATSWPFARPFASWHLQHACYCSAQVTQCRLLMVIFLCPGW
jgi:hypothetical protein